MLDSCRGNRRRRKNTRNLKSAFEENERSRHIDQAFGINIDEQRIQDLRQDSGITVNNASHTPNSVTVTRVNRRDTSGKQSAGVSQELISFVQLQETDRKNKIPQTPTDRSLRAQSVFQDSSDKITLLSSVSAPVKRSALTLMTPHRLSKSPIELHRTKSRENKNIVPNDPKKCLTRVQSVSNVSVRRIRRSSVTPSSNHLDQTNRIISSQTNKNRVIVTRIK